MTGQSIVLGMSIVTTEDRGPVRHVVLNRPEKRNAMNEELVRGIGEALEAARIDQAVKVVVLRGAGPMFSSGMDFKDLGALAADPSNLRAFRRPILDAWNIAEEMAKPVICQIHGGCIGGAMELALACDLRVMAEDAIIGMPETRVGLIPDVGGSSRLPAIVGLGRAKELIMASKLINGTEAERIGLVNRVAPADELDAATEQLVASCWPARRPRSAWPSASSTASPSRRSRRRSSTRSPSSRSARSPTTSPRAPARSPRSASPSSAGATGRP
jgi:enoyl-CoA hydratase/carnithine racemase